MKSAHGRVIQRRFKLKFSLRFTLFVRLESVYLLVYSGLFKEAKKKLKNGDLDYLKEIDPTEYIYQIFYIWKQKEYLASELYDLTEQEKREINHKMIDEIEEEQ